MTTARKVTAYTVQYGRDGWAPGNLFVSRVNEGAPWLQLNTPLEDIRLNLDDALALAAEIQTLCRAPLSAGA